MINWYWIGIVVVGFIAFNTVYEEWDTLTDWGRFLAVAVALLAAVWWPLTVLVALGMTAYDYYMTGEVTWWL